MDARFVLSAAVIIVGMLFTALIIANKIRDASRQQKMSLFRGERAAAYQVLIQLWQERLLQSPGLESDSNNSSEELRALDRLLLVYGNPDVIQAHAVLRALEKKVELQAPKFRSQLIQVLIEIRKDIGSDIRSLKLDELEQLLFVDSPELNITTKANIYGDLQPRVSLISLEDR